MNIDFIKIANAARKVRTPLAVSGLAILILYGLYKMVLSLNIFSKVGEDSTVMIVTRILDNTFWLAITAIIMGIGSQIISMLTKKQRSLKADVALVDQRLVDNRNGKKEKHSNDGG